MTNRERNRRKRRLIAYALRTAVATVLLGMTFLMICGCLYLRDKFRKEEVEEVTPPVVESQGEQGNNEKIHKIEKNVTILLDAGHGGVDSGTYHGDLLEKDINLNVVSMMKELLEEQGFTVLLTRGDDSFIGLEDRVSEANEKNIDLFLSIHSNYCEEDSNVAGLECYYYGKSEQGEEYAKGIFTYLKNSGKINCKDAIANDFYVLRSTSVPAVLVELGYLSNSGERQKLQDSEYQKVLAEELVEGILSLSFSKSD